MVINNLKFNEQNSSVGDNIPLFQFNDTDEVIIDTLTIKDNSLTSTDKRRNLQSLNDPESYMDPYNK
jgi:hypothetical protein